MNRDCALLAPDEATLSVVSSPQQYVFFFNFNFGLFSNLLSFSGRFYPPYFFDHTNCVIDHAKFCSREGMRAIVNKYLYPVHKNKLDLRYLFPIFLSETYFLHGMPAGHDVSRFRSGIFFFIGVINVHINLCIKLCPPLVRIYCSDCL